MNRLKDKSRAVSSHLTIPVPEGLSYMPFQKAGIEFIQNHDRVLLADEMGLGKTIQTIGAANLLDLHKILVICPASVKINWINEFTKWGIRDLPLKYLKGKKDDFLGDGVVTMNFELLNSYSEALRQIPWDLLVVDEAHYLKNSKADRTGQVFGRKQAKGPNKPRLTPIPFNRLLLLTGTPILNKPKELWSLLQVLDPLGLGSDWFSFARRYCELFEIEQFDPAKGKKVHQGWKWDGAANLEELQTIMRSRFMIRRLKKDVLKELPPKTRQVIVLDAKKGLTNLLERERLYYADYVKIHGEEIVEPPSFTEMSKIRKEVAIAKIPYVIEYLEEVLNESKKLVVWIHHQDVSDAIMAHFSNISLLVDGRTNIESRQRNVDLFQNNPNVRIFIGGIQAAGVGLTLTAANIAVFAELDWTPALVSQAEDRLHRIGQKENVLIRHIILNGSLEQRIVQALIKKQEIIEKALDSDLIYLKPLLGD